MSPFEDVVTHLAERIRGLSHPAQTALFASAAAALAPRYADWSAAAGLEPADPLLQRSLDEASSLVTGAIGVASRDLLESVEAATLDGPIDAEWFTAAQDCWVCIDTALRAGLDDFDPATSTWYLLEPMFQATSERLFGYSDVGTGDEFSAETVALADALLAAAVSAVSQAVDRLENGAPTRDLLANLTMTLRSIRP